MFKRKSSEELDAELKKAKAENVDVKARSSKVEELKRLKGENFKASRAGKFLSGAGNVADGFFKGVVKLADATAPPPPKKGKKGKAQKKKKGKTMEDYNNEMGKLL